MNIYEIVEDVLKNNPKYVSEDGKLLKATVYSDVMTMDKELLSLLLDHEKIKDQFFENLDGTLIFDKQKFAWFIASKEFLPDSYTKYTNKIGLTYNGNFISKSNDVVLDFPYKDCFLEGGQDKDDQKRDEIFYNEIIASDEISKMLAPKVFTNAKRYTKDSIEEDISFNENDNLIIKGNNLIVLYSLLDLYEGKIKCIYIDPPYNTGSDSFKYNDNFNRSSWLIFMKNRLEIAKRLLSDDGIIFIQCDYNEDSYLRILMDEIFTAENFVANIAVKSSTPSGIKTAHKDKKIIKQKDTLLVYKKNNISIEPQYVARDKWDTHYSLFLTKEDGKYKFEKVIDVLNSQGFNYKGLDEIIPTDEKVRAFIEHNANNIICLQSHKNKDVERISREKYKNIVYENIINGQIENLYFNGRVVTPIAKGVKNVLVGKKIKKYWATLLCDFWSDIDFQNTQNEGGVSLTNGKKPEALLKRIIDMVTKPNDIILDYHVGSGTTCAVAHKMGRRWIGIEQMDYIEDITKVRLLNVLNGEKSGISTAINWQGGGSFVYCELLENAETLIDQIQSATEENISEIKEFIYSDERIIPYITRKELNKINDIFKELTLEEKKKSLIQLVDKNKLYVNYSDIEDKTFDINESDKNFTKSFYEGV